MGWHIERNGSRLRIDLDGAPIGEATEQELVFEVTTWLDREHGIDAIRFNGPGVRRPAEGVVRLIRAVGEIARDRELRYKVSRN